MNALDTYLISLAALVAKESGDLEKKVGCVITDRSGVLLTTGYNDIPSDCAHTPDRRCRPHKYKWTEHAERRALNSAARYGHAIAGSTAYVTYFPCHECARSMVDAGISRVVSAAPDLTHPRWGESWSIALEIFTDAKTEITLVEVPSV